MNNNKIKALATLLEQEINWVDALNILLADERLALETVDVDKLEVLAAKKQELSSFLEESAKQRMELFNISNPDDPLTSTLDSFLESSTPTERDQINTLNNKLAEILVECRDLNIINGQVIATQIHSRQQIVSILSGTNTDAIGVYTATGTMQATSEHIHHQKA